MTAGDHLLPVNASTPHMMATSIAQKRILDVDMDVIRRSVLASASPAALLPWVAWDRSVDEWSDSWEEAVKRQVVAGSFSYHSVKGTPAALKRALGQLDYDTTVSEWFEYGGAPYRFRVRYTIPENTQRTEAEFRLLVRLIMAAKNKRSMIDALQASAVAKGPAPYIAAYGPRRGRSVTLYPDPDQVPVPTM